jgi:uncharacterized membrane protein YjgN (DUF898 family)
MSLADLWDRFFWSIMVTIFAGLLWLKFLEPYAPCIGPGLVVALVIGSIYFYLGFRQMRQSARQTSEKNEREV